MAGSAAYQQKNSSPGFCSSCAENRVAVTKSKNGKCSFNPAELRNRCASNPSTQKQSYEVKPKTQKPPGRKGLSRGYGKDKRVTIYIKPDYRLLRATSA